MKRHLLFSGRVKGKCWYAVSEGVIGKWSSASAFWSGVHCGGGKVRSHFPPPPSRAYASALFIDRCELSVSPLTVPLLMTPELWWFDSWMLSHFMLHYVVLPYVCKTFDDLRSAFIHVSSWSACGELVRSVLLASFYGSGTWGLECGRHLPKITGLEDDGDRPRTSFSWIPGREDNCFLFLLFWLPPARTRSGVRGD